MSLPARFASDVKSKGKGYGAQDLMPGYDSQEEEEEGEEIEGSRCILHPIYPIL